MSSGLQPHRVIIIPERSIPKTTSGKVQRRQTRRLVDEKKLRVLYDSAGLIAVEGSLLTNALSALKQAFPWSLGAPSVQEEDESMSRCNSTASLVALEDEPRPRSFSERDDVAEIEATLLTELRKVAKGTVTATTAFHELGLSSRQMVELLRQVEVALDVDLPPTVVFSCPTVRALAHEVVGLRGGSTIMAPPVVQESDGDDVGVVGWSLRLPGACDSLEELDSILNNKVRCGTTIPTSRWDWRVTDAQLAASGADSDARSRAQYGAFCLGSAGFDPRTWGLRPAEATALDPQQKLLLRQGHELLRNRYDTKDELRGSSIGVMLGMMSADNVYGVEPCHAGPHQLTGNGYASCASRLSFLLDLRGPALVVDTACSGALVAARLGHDAVRRNDCSTCVVGGVSLMLAPGLIHCGAARAGMLSPSGRCHTFDRNADGYLRGEGCALLLLEKDTNIKWRGSSVMHNGQSATFTALNASSQKDLLRRALQGTSVTSVEAHGTGTRLGDPIEVSALSLLDRVCVSGAKSCLGHGEPNAGAAGLLSAMLSLSSIKPNGALRRLNPVVRVGSIVLPTEATLTKKGAVGVSSFGYSGIIAHAVLSGTLEVVPTKVRFADDRPLTQVPPQKLVHTSALDAALHESPSLRDVTFHKNGQGPFSVVVDGDLITVRDASDILLTATRCTDEVVLFRPPPPATLEEVSDFYTELKEATAAPSSVVGSEVIARAWVSSRGAVGACASKDAFEACRQLACLVRRREDVGGRRWWEPASCDLVVSKGGVGPAWASVRTTARSFDRGVVDASVSDVLELRGLVSVPVEAGPSSLQDVRLYALRSHAIQSIEGDQNVDVLSDLPPSLPSNKTGRPRYTTASVRTASPEVALALSSADDAWARLSDERGPPLAVACVALHGKSALLAGAHDSRDLALACAQCTNVRAAFLEETEATTRAPSTFAVYVAKHAPASLRDASLKVGTKVLDESPVANADVVFVRGAWVRVISRSARAFAQCAALSQKTRGADVACVLWRGPKIGAEEVVRLALKCSVPRCVALATPALIVPTRAPTTAKNPMKATSTREAVARAARDALGVDDIDETASLSDLGMDSLAGAEFVADLSRRLGRAVAPALLIECDTVDAIVSALGEDEVVVEEVEEVVVREPRSRRLACAPSSKDQELLLWMLRRARTRSIKPGYAWLPPTAVGLLEGALNEEALEWALSRVVEAHDALCSRLVEVPGANKALVVFGVDEKPRLEKRTATTVEEAKSMAQTYHDASPNDPYESTSLLRALLISTPSHEHVLYLSCNHAITDGWSHQVLYGELVRAYNARLQGSEAPFGHEERPYAAWLSEQPTSVHEGRKRRYARCARLPAWPQLSTTDVLFETGSLLRNAIAKVLPKEILDNVKRRLSPKCSLPSVVLAAYAHALGRAARGEASVVQYSHPGRTKLDRRTYGQLATDANVLLDDLSAAPTLGGFAESVHRAVLEALANPTPYADDYVACTNGREAPLPAQYNWYDRYGDVPQWSGITRATELSLDSSSLAQKTFNIGAVYLMALVQGDGALKLVCYFNDAFYGRPTILDALGDVSAFLARFAEDPSLSLPSLSAGESNGAGARE
jgi:acyl carrier protein